MDVCLVCRIARLLLVGAVLALGLIDGISAASRSQSDRYIAGAEALPRGEVIAGAEVLPRGEVVAGETQAPARFADGGIGHPRGARPAR